MNADEAISRGAALQSAILSPRFKVLPYEIVEAQPYPVKISWEGEDPAPAEGEEAVNSVIMFDRNSNFNIVRRVSLRRPGEIVVNASYDEKADSFGFPSGASKDIVQFKIKAPEGNTNKIRVNVKQDINGSILLSSAQMMEEIIEEEPAEAKKEEAEAKEGEEVKKEEEKVEKKKKTKKTFLEFFQTRPLDWTKAELDAAFEKEVAMANVDRVFKETADMRNELESYIYDMRDKIISESHLKSFATDEERSTFSDSLEKTENWLYEDGFDAVKKVYAEKLAALKVLGTPIEMRQSESKSRPNAIAVLQRTVEKFQSWLNTSTGDEQYSHITEEEFKKCHESCDASSSWMYDMMDKQGSVAANQDPVVTTAEINAKTNELTKVISPIMHKPKPKPKPEEKKEPEEKPAEAAEPMETDEAAKKPAEETEPMETESTA